MTKIVGIDIDAQGALALLDPATAPWHARRAKARCLSCGGVDNAHDPLLPHGVVESTGYAWLYSGQKVEAVTAMAAMRITSPADFPDDFGKNGGA